MGQTLIDSIVLQGMLFAAVVAFATGIWILGSEYKSSRDRTVSLLLSASAIWVFSYILWRTAPEPLQAQFWLRSMYFIASFVPVAFALFALVIFWKRLPSRNALFVIFSPQLVIFWVTYFTDSVLGRSSVLLTPAVGGGALLLAVHYIFFALVGLGMLFITMRRKKDDEGGRLFLLLAGGISTMVPIFLFLFFYIVIAVTYVPFIIPLGVLTGVLLIGVSTFRVRRRADASMFGIEILVFVVLFILATDTMASASSQADLAVRITLLILLLVFGVLMTRSHAKEILRLQNIEAMHAVLVQMNGKLLEADRVKTKFVSFASHQLRAPIGGIRGYLDMLRNGDFGKLTKKQIHIIDMNLEALERLTSTIKTFLDVTKIEFGKFELFRTYISIQELVEHAVDEMYPVIEKKGLHFEVEVKDGLPNLWVDAGKLHHVLVNLIDNAVKYTEKGTVTLFVVQEGDEIIFRVQDSGIGLTRKDRDRIFHVFERGISAVKLESSGAGLGLHIVKNIIEVHGGRIIVESGGRNKGSVFGFALPLNQKQLK